MSSVNQPGSIPLLLPVCHALSPTAPLLPMATEPFGPVATCPKMLALPTLSELTRPELVATSPLSLALDLEYWPP